MSPGYDAIVIGAGHNYIARAGQSGALRPIPALGHYRTPVANVYLCGSGTHPGAGVSMASGRNAAQTISEDLRLNFKGMVGK